MSSLVPGERKGDTEAHYTLIGGPTLTHTAPRAAIIGAPALSSYQGAVAYVVTLDKGTIYVEATTGRVLVNTVVRRCEAAISIARTAASANQIRCTSSIVSVADR